MNNIVILGATGSIGSSTLRVIDNNQDKFSVIALSANKNWQKMLILCRKYRPNQVVMVDKNAALKLQQQVNIPVLTGEEGLLDIVKDTDADMIMVAIVGSCGILPTLTGIKFGKRILLANKESIVIAGKILMEEAQKNKTTIIPVDSEHSAIFQVLQGNNNGVKKIQLTASGGPFLTTPLKDLKNITPMQACNHPNWSMGKKISIDSSTMMNKGLEIIEAHHLFAIEADKLDVIIHPQSIMHSSVFFIDGSVISQLGKPDMRTAISYSMSYPQRMNCGVESIDFSQHKLEFFAVDKQKFKSIDLAINAIQSGSSSLVVFNATNEIAVAAFLAGKIGWLDITEVVEKNLEKLSITNLSNIDDILSYDKYVRIKAQELL